MMRFCQPREVPGRLVTGVWIMRAGRTKWNGDRELATTVHGMAAATYPMLGKVEPMRFMRTLGAAEVVVGAALLIPVVPATIAGGALAGFSAGLLGMYVARPDLRDDRSIFPNERGRTLAKDVWMLGIGLNLLIDGLTSSRRSPRARRTPGVAAA